MTPGARGASGRPRGTARPPPSHAVPPTAAGLEPALPRALLAPERGRVAGFPVEAEAKAQAPGTVPHLRGFRGLPTARVVRGSVAKREVTTGWVLADVGALLAARPPLPHSGPAPRPTRPPPSSLWRRDAGTRRLVLRAAFTLLPGPGLGLDPRAEGLGPGGVAGVLEAGRGLTTASGSRPVPEHARNTGYRVNTELSYNTKGASIKLS